MKSKRILYLAPATGISIRQSGGAGTHMRGVIKGFRENGFEVLPIIGGDEFNLFSEELRDKSHAESAQSPSLRGRVKSMIPRKVLLGLRDLRTWVTDRKLERKALSKIEAFKPDYIYERASYLSTLGVRLSKRFGIPLFLETDGCMVEIIEKDYGVFSAKLGNWFERKKLQAAQFTVVMNKLAVDVVASKFGLDREKFVVKTLGVDPDSFVTDELATQMLRQKYKLEQKFIVGFVGAISTYHGVRFLIDAAEIIAGDQDSNIFFLIVGWSKEGQALADSVKERKIGNVIFAGQVDKAEIANYYSLFDVGVIPDCEESIYPIKVLEYGLMKVCPLVPDYNVFRELIVPHLNGYVFRPQDASSMATSLIELGRNTAEVGNCAYNWNREVVSRFKWSESVQDILKVMQSYEASAPERVD